MRACRIYLQQKITQISLLLLSSLLIAKLFAISFFILTHIKRSWAGFELQCIFEMRNGNNRQIRNVNNSRNANNLWQAAGKNHVVAAAGPDPHQKCWAHFTQGLGHLLQCPSGYSHSQECEWSIIGLYSLG